MGATADGQKELIAVADGYRESEQSWSELLISLKNRGLSQAPKLAIGDGALGFWAARRKIFPKTGHPVQVYSVRKIFSIFRPFASSSTNLSKYLTCCVNGFLISSTR